MANKQLIILLAVILLVSLFCVQIVAASSNWVEYAGNPVFNPVIYSAYYPCVLYNSNQFSSHGDSYYYKMWYDTGSSVRLAYSKME